jgi:hypothetical protein
LTIAPVHSLESAARCNAVPSVELLGEILKEPNLEELRSRFREGKGGRAGESAAEPLLEPSAVALADFAIERPEIRKGKAVQPRTQQMIH